jgi:putative AbiEi antitoxin of type IV toxin-antitoxin system
VRRIAPPYVPEFDAPYVDAAIAQLAARQHGVVAIWQLLSLGLSASAVRTRVAAGKLHRVHRGVYSVGHSVLSMDGRRMAAVLACGPTAVASHRMAGALLAIVSSSALEVTVPTQADRRIPGVVVHRTRRLDPEDIGRIDNIPCTALPRTLIDYAELATRRQVERACEQAEILRTYDQRAIDAAIERNPGRRGAKRLVAVVADFRPGTTPTANDIEEAMLAICDGIRAPRPLVNAWIPFPDGGGARPDFLWPGPKKIVEVDGYETHGTRGAFESDRARDRRLKLMRYEILHYTWRDITLRPERVAVELAAFLALP